MVDVLLKLCYRNRNIVYFEQECRMIMVRKYDLKLFFMIKIFSYYSLAKQIVFTLFLFERL